MSSTKRRFLYCTLFAAILLVDGLTKWLVHTNLSLISAAAPLYPYGGVGVFENILGIEFSLSYAANKGAAWGVGAQFQSYLIILRILCIVGLFAYLAFVRQCSQKTIPFILILAGATGNVVDTFFYGHVVDMFHFVLWGYDYPVFNVADISIFLGVSALLFQSIYQPTPKETTR